MIDNYILQIYPYIVIPNSTSVYGSAKCFHLSKKEIDNSSIFIENLCLS